MPLTALIQAYTLQKRGLQTGESLIKIIVKVLTSDGVQLVGGGRDPLVQGLHVAVGAAQVEVGQGSRHPETI